MSRTDKNDISNLFFWKQNNKKLFKKLCFFTNVKIIKNCPSLVLTNHQRADKNWPKIQIFYKIGCSDWSTKKYIYLLKLPYLWAWISKKEGI